MSAPEDHPDQPPGSTPAATGLPEITPDIVEQEQGDRLDNIIPTGGYSKVPVVGLGGSAGGLQALQAFFAAMPPDSGMAFVVILHLSPQHGSILAEVLQRATAMPVAQVQGRVRIEPNRVYVIPPAKHLSMTDDALVLTHTDREPGRHVAVDVFFRTLADTMGPHGVAIVLSGADGDGAIGLKRVKERGGLTVAQDPEEAEQQSMPCASIATGLVDWVLPVAEMPARLVKYWRTESRLHIPEELEGRPIAPGETPAGSEDRVRVENTLHDILGFLRVRAGHDFTYYKRGTVLRRIGRRMQVNGLDDPRAYLEFLRTQTVEPAALLRDLLISVTNFFRDREAFAAFEARVPSFFRDKGPGDQVRVWVPACATGEEAYSVAMLLHEYAATLTQPPTLQVFATDLDEHAINQARDSRYPRTIAADVGEERLRRFFTREHGGYRVRRELRETVLFAEHDLLKDAPFSRMDLISCRNLLIYFDREAQDRAMDVFHFALRPNGRLFLGNSETVDESRGLFASLDKKHRIYVRRPALRLGLGLPVPTGTGTLLRAMQAQGTEAPVIPGAAFARSTPFTLPPASTSADEHAATTELHLKLLERLAPPSVVINEQQDIVHLSESAGRFLQVVGGPPTMNLLRMVNPALRTDLRAAVFRAADVGKPVDMPGVPVELEGSPKVVDLRVTPAPELAPGYLVVTFEARVSGQAEAANAPARVEAENVVRYLEREVGVLRGRLRDTVERCEASAEEYRASAEEYRASNEELQAMNEELRSASEELETSREELQSINEELNTVNLELKSRVEEVGQVNGDLQNFMSATDIATVFLDRELKVMRYTQASVGFFKLIPGDTGRPLADLRFQVEYPELIDDAHEVLRTLVPVEREVGQSDAGWFLARLLPYRTTDDRIGGVVLTFVDISARKRAEIVRRITEEQFQSFVAATSDAVYKMNADWTEMRFLKGKQFLGDTSDPSRTWVETYIPLEEQSAVLAAIRQAIREKNPFQLEHRVIRADGTVGWTLSRAIPLLDERGEISEWFGTAQDVTERRQAAETLQTSLQETEEARTVAEAASVAKDQFLAVLSHELRTPLTPVVMALDILDARTDLPPVVRDALEMIGRNVRLETRFIDNLLDMTRISRGKLEFVRADTDLHETIRRAVEVSAPDLTEKEQTLAVDLGATQHGLPGDSARLQQVFWNLLKNASKFTPEGGRITLRTRNAPGRIVVEVTDSGIGWEAGAAERIFRPFEQADGTIAGRFGGLGLGLSIARATVAAHGGEIHASSPGRDQGATFTVDLPADAAS